jgi:hypothetical protein
MEPLTQQETQQMALSLQTLVGSRLQDLRSAGEELGLGFYVSNLKGLTWVWIDLKATCPMLLLLDGAPGEVQGTGKRKGSPRNQKPVLLFLKTHFLGRRLRDVRSMETLGRVIYFDFGEDSGASQIEVRLFPQGQNVLVHHEVSGKKGAPQKKSISWNKPLALVASKKASDSSGVRSLPELHRQWALDRGGLALTGLGEKGLKARWERDLEKKRVALERMRSDYDLKAKADVWRPLGEWLKEHQTLDVPSVWKEVLPKKLTFPEAIAFSFQKAKLNEKKMTSSIVRMKTLAHDIEELEGKIASGDVTKSESQAIPETVQFKIPVKMRTLRISEGLQAYVGRSAKDNLLLLRQAQPWDIWMHLSDRPGAHVILRKQKNQTVAEVDLEKVAQWLIKETASRQLQSGDVFEVLVSEVRFVRPIKGDKLGRVIVTEKKTRRYRVRPES